MRILFAHLCLLGATLGHTNKKSKLFLCSKDEGKLLAKNTCFTHIDITVDPPVSSSNCKPTSPDPNSPIFLHTLPQEPNYDSFERLHTPHALNMPPPYRKSFSPNCDYYDNYDVNTRE